MVDIWFMMVNDGSWFPQFSFNIPWFIWMEMIYIGCEWDKNQGSNGMTMISSHDMGGFHTWGIPKMDGLCHGKSIYKWMMTGGYPCSSYINQSNC